MASREVGSWHRQEAVARLSTWVTWGRKLKAEALCTGKDLMSQAGRCRAVTIDRRPLSFPFVLSRGNLDVIIPHGWPLISHQVSLGLGALCISQASLSWKPTTDYMPTRVRLDRGPLGEQMRGGSGEGKEARGDAVYVYIYWWFTELSDISPHV